MNDQKILAVLAGIVLPVVGLHAGAFFGAVILWNHAETDFPLFEVGGGALLGALLGYILAVFAIKNLFPTAMKVYLVTVGWLLLVFGLGILGFFIVGQVHFSLIGYKILAERIEPILTRSPAVGRCSTWQASPVRVGVDRLYRAGGQAVAKAKEF
jgi:hypothetical protein